MSQIIQQKVQVRNQKFDTVNWPLALYKWVSILPWGLRALTPIGWLPDWFIADTDVQWQFSIVFNTDALPFAWAVSGTQYYYEDTFPWGDIVTTSWPKPLGIGVSWTTSEETWYIILNYKFQTQVPENVVPTPYASLALATADATASPVTIIAEVVNAGDPSENGVYAIEPNGDTKKLDSWLTNKYSATWGGSASLTHTQTLNFKVNTDKTITEAQISWSDALIPYSPLRVDASNNVFTKAGDIYPVLSTATTEPMAIDTATGQIGRFLQPTTYNYDYDSWFLQVDTNTTPTYNTAQHNHWANTYTPPSFIVPTAPTWYTYYIVWHLYTIIANQSYYNCSLSHYIDLFVNWVQQSRGSITQLPNEEIFYDGDVNSMMQDVSAGVNTLRIDIDSRKVIGWSVTSLWWYTDHALLMRIKAKILLRKI